GRCGWSGVGKDKSEDSDSDATEPKHEHEHGGDRNVAPARLRLCQSQGHAGQAETLLRLKKRRMASEKPVQTSSAPPAETAPARVCPIQPPASPVCSQRTQRRIFRAGELLS